MKKYFGTDGVRGIANTELTNEFAYNLARSIVKYINKDKCRIAMGMDTRLSSDMIAMSMAAGFIAEGAEIVSLGIVSTPCVAFITREYKFDMGIMVSASHNPYMYNGIKLIDHDGFKLSDEVEIEIEKILDSLSNENKSGDELGRYIRDESYGDKYIEHIESISSNSFKGLKIGIDAGDGVMSYFAPRVFKEMGAEVHTIYCDGNGRFINDDSGSTNPHKIADLVKENALDIGVSFDGDADRVIFSDENGEIIDGDHIIAFAAKNYLDKNLLKNNKVVTTSMSNQAFENYLSENGIGLIRADVGDKYVMEEMVKNNLLVGGEKSGHIIFLDHNTMGDGLQTAVLTIDMLVGKAKKASYISSLFKDFPQVLVNAAVSDKLKKSYNENERISEAIKVLKSNNPDFRILIRPSGTEKLVRIMLEGRDMNKIEQEANRLKDIIEEESNNV